MPRSQGRIIVSPTAPLEVLAGLGSCQAYSQKITSARGDDPGEASRSASPSNSPRQRPRRLPGGHFMQDESPSHGAPREAWGAGAGAINSARSGGSSRGTGRKPKRGESCPQPLAPQMSVEWHATTLFGGERCTNHKAKRSSATTFRKPTSSRAPAHSRPIFVVGQDAQDPRICVDINAPGRFSSFERTRYELSWRQANSTPDAGSRPEPQATIRNIGNNCTGRSSAQGGRSFGGGRSGTPQGYRGAAMRPESVASVGTYRSSGPSPLPGQRPPAAPMCRPSTTPAVGMHRSAPPVPACWSGA